MTWEASSTHTHTHTHTSQPRPVIHTKQQKQGKGDKTRALCLLRFVHLQAFWSDRGNTKGAFSHNNPNSTKAGLQWLQLLLELLDKPQDAKTSPGKQPI